MCSFFIKLNLHHYMAIIKIIDFFTQNMIFS